MKTTRFSILIALALLFVGIAALTHMGLQQFLTDATVRNSPEFAQAIQAVDGELEKLDSLPLVNTSENKGARPDAPGAPTPPTPPVLPLVPVPLELWIAVTLACFAPFAVGGWYLDRRTNAAVYEQPLA